MSNASAIAQAEKLIYATQQAAQAAARTASSGSSTDNSTDDASNALATLANSYTTFLTLLTTQLQNQDPTSPMSTNAFTTELAQFTGVEQQVETNQKLSSLISLNESAQLTNDSDLVGRTANATTTELPLQNGSASLSFNGLAGEPIAIAVANAAGQVVYTDAFSAQNGTNTWTWNGKDSNGNVLPNGAYNVAVETITKNGDVSPVTFTVNGTITSITKGNSDINVQMGKVSVPMTDVNNLSTLNLANPSSPYNTTSKTSSSSTTPSTSSVTS
ncbi:MAG: flagellar biosynthesis protein FlgD [Acetobacter sp.]|nr:flagellar biosynthesis protein FlgD [Acetobacter sp.]